MKNTTLTNAERFAHTLKRHGIRYIFGQSNPQAITLACDDIGIKQIGYRQENAGTYMAMGYAMTAHTIGIVTAQNGPAATLLVPGLAEALKASHPMLAIVQDVSLNDFDRNAFQELDHIKLFEGCTKWAKRILSADRIEEDLELAITTAMGGRPGPVALLCPKDIFNDLTAKRMLSPHRTVSLGSYPIDRPMADPSCIERAAALLSQAKRPLIYAGGGVIGSGASEELRALQEACALPVATTTMGKGGVDETHPLTLGPIGYYMGNRSSAEFMKPLVRDADVILLVGNRTNQNGTDSWTILPNGATYIHIDIDPVEIGRNYEASVRLCGDAKVTLAALKEAMCKQDLSLRKEARAELEQQIAAAKKKHEQKAGDVLLSEAAPVRIERFLHELDAFLEDDHIIVADASFSSIWLANYLKATGNRKFLFPRGLAGLGWGLPMAMGAKLAAPDRKVFCLAGDGGFAHVWSELETCKRVGIGVVFAVINNAILGYQKCAELNLWDRYTNICDFAPVDHTKVAQACGLKGIAIHTPADILPALKEAMVSRETVLLDIHTDVQCIPPVPYMASLEGNQKMNCTL